MEKEDRRKKIVSRGDNRMALITGRIRTLNADPLPKSTSFTIPRPDSCPPQHIRSSSEPHIVEDQNLIPDHQINDVHSEGGNRSERNQSEISRARVERGKAYLDGLEQSITSTENTRAICAMMLAYLVLLCHVNLVDSKPSSFITYSPLSIVLLTDVALVISTLIPYMKATRKAKEEKEQQRMVNDEENEDLGRAATKIFELALAAYQIIGGIFIDSSLYLVIVVSGLSLLA